MAPTVTSEPIARGLVLALPVRHGSALTALAKESVAILKALKAEARAGDAPQGDEDFLVLLTEPDSDVDRLALPELKDRAASALGVAEQAAEGRVVVTRARKRLRERGAALGARELVLSPTDFGYLGLESDGLRERLEILLQALVLDAERLRLKREGWEEP